MFDFKEYEKILIGIGESFQAKVPEEIADGVDTLMYIRENADSNIIGAYNILSDRLKECDYFVVSTCNDDLIYDSNLNKDRIVTPCGGFRFLQCEDDCAHELLPFSDNMCEEINEIRCPHCGKRVVFNRLPLDKYNEGGYMEQWEQYNKWLQSTINKKLLIIELGVSMKYPTVIRFPFEKTAFYNQKADMYRIHDSLAFSTPELKDRCRCIKANPIEYLATI